MKKRLIVYSALALILLTIYACKIRLDSITVTAEVEMTKANKTKLPDRKSVV